MKKLVLGKPPSVNHLYGYNRHTGGHYLKDDGKRWFEDSGWEIQQQLRGVFNQLKGKFHKAKLKLVVTIYFWGKFDIDNGMKATLDLLTKVQLIRDDSQIYELVVKKVKAINKEDQKMELELIILEDVAQ